MTRIQRDTIAYVCILVVSVALLVWLIPKYSPPYPGYGASPALVPNVAVAIMLVMAVLALLRNGFTYWWGRTRRPEESEFPDEGESSGFTQVGRIRLWHLARLVIPCALLIPALYWFDYIPVAIVFMLVIQYVIGRREPIPAVILAVAMALFMYAAMRYGFSVPLPGA